MKCNNCGGDIVIPQRVYRFLESYDVGGQKTVASECCQSAYTVRMNIKYETEVYTGKKSEDDWGVKFKKHPKQD
jgi:hypothetical protein